MLIPSHLTRERICKRLERDGFGVRVRRGQYSQKDKSFVYLTEPCREMSVKAGIGTVRTSDTVLAVVETWDSVYELRYQRLVRNHQQRLERFQQALAEPQRQREAANKELLEEMVDRYKSMEQQRWTWSGFGLRPLDHTGVIK